MRRRHVAGATAGALTLLLAGGAPSALAFGEWCPDDPTVVVKTPGGGTVVLHVTNYALGREHLAALRRATVTHAVAPTRDGAATDVTLTVLIPGDALASSYPVRSVASSKPLERGTVYADGSGTSGKPIQLRFRLNVR